MQVLLGIDLGTTGVKAALFAVENGRAISSAFVDYPLLHPQPGWAEQHPADRWRRKESTLVSDSRRCAWGGIGDDKCS